MVKKQLIARNKRRHISLSAASVIFLLLRRHLG